MGIRGALICDVVGSSSLSDLERQRLDISLKKCFRVFNKEYNLALSGNFDYSVGDEFEAAFAVPEAAIRPIFLVHSWLASQTGSDAVQIRSAVGIGRISVEKSRRPSRQDGPAFHIARNVIQDLDISHCRIGIRCCGDDSIVKIANLSLGIACRFLDSYLLSWTLPQWEAVYWRLKGQRLSGIADKLGISKQNVSKRLKSANYDLVDASISDIENILRNADLQLSVAVHGEIL